MMLFFKNICCMSIITNDLLKLIDVIRILKIYYVLLSESSAGGDAESASETVDVSRLDMRVGFIVNAKKHPDADALYVEEVDVGEGKIRTVVSGLVKHIPLEQVSEVEICQLETSSEQLLKKFHILAIETKING